MFTSYGISLGSGSAELLGLPLRSGTSLLLVTVTLEITECVCVRAQSCPTLCNSMQPCQAPLSMKFPRQEYWSGLPFPFPGDLSDPGMEPPSPALAGGFFTTKPPGEPFTCISSFNYHDNPGREVIVSPLCGLRYWGLI